MLSELASSLRCNFSSCVRLSKTSNNCHKDTCSPIQRFFSTTPIHLAKDYYAILGLAKSATKQEIKTAYYDKAKAYHPDSNTSTEAVTKFREVSEAYEVLGNEQKRRVYDSARFDGRATQSFYGTTTTKRSEPLRPRQNPSEPISMKHINHVYKALNQNDLPDEKPQFVPFADHNYPGSSYNRFEYSRRWDSCGQRYVYTRRRSAKQYEKLSQEKANDRRKVMYIILGGVGLFSLWRFSTIQQPPWERVSEPAKELTSYQQSLKEEKENFEKLKGEKAIG